VHCEQGLAQGTESAAAVSSASSQLWEEETGLYSLLADSALLGLSTGEVTPGSGAGETALGSWVGSSIAGSGGRWPAARLQSSHLWVAAGPEHQRLCMNALVPLGASFGSG